MDDVPTRPLAIYEQHIKGIVDTELMAIIRFTRTKVPVADHGFGAVAVSLFGLTCCG